MLIGSGHGRHHDQGPARCCPGTYDLSASVWDFPILHAYDQRSRVMRFDVLPGDRMEGFGLVTLRPGVVDLGRRPGLGRVRR